jgi:hypothetical protein
MISELLAQATLDGHDRLMAQIRQEELVRSTNPAHTSQVTAALYIKRMLRHCLSPLKNLIEWAETEVTAPVQS